MSSCTQGHSSCTIFTQSTAQAGPSSLLAYRSAPRCSFLCCSQCLSVLFLCLISAPLFILCADPSAVFCFCAFLVPPCSFFVLLLVLSVSFCVLSQCPLVRSLCCSQCCLSRSFCFLSDPLFVFCAVLNAVCLVFGAFLVPPFYFFVSCLSVQALLLFSPSASSL